MKTYLLKTGVRQAIAKAGETDIAVAYNAKTWIDEYPAGNPQLMVTTPGGKRVPVTVEAVDNLITGQVPNELLAGPGVYSYVFVWTSGSTQLESGRCECLVLGSNLAKDLAHDSRRTPEWAERIFLAAEVIEGAIPGMMEARNTTADNAAEAKTAAEAAAESESAAADSAEAAAASEENIDTILTNMEQTITDATAAMNGIEAQKNTMIASIASVAGQGTDTTLTQSGVAADAKAAGDQISDLKSAVVTPQMFGAVGDGVTDDTQALQDALDSAVKLFIPSGRYAISSTLTIDHDKTIICDSDATIVPIANIDIGIAIGCGTVQPIDPVLSGLLKCEWKGGNVLCKNGNYTITTAIKLGKLYHSRLTDASILECVGTGVYLGDGSGAGAFCDGVVVHGVSGGLAECGFYVNMYDQRLFNCTAIDCAVGFNAQKGYVRFNGCFAWVSHSTNWDNTIGYYIKGENSALVECTMDTVKTGVVFTSNATNTTITNPFWMCNANIIPDYTDMVLFKGASGNVSVCGTCIGLESMAFNKPVKLMQNITGLKIIGINSANTSYISDYIDVIQLEKNDATAIKVERTGQLITISDGADNVPMGRLNVKIGATQDGSGTASPSNVRDIIGKTTANVGRCGTNLFKSPAAGTISGITLAYNSDGSIKLTGTSEDVVYFDCYAGNFDTTLFAGYQLTLGCNESITGVSARISTSNRSALQEVVSNGVASIIDNGSGLYLAIRIHSGVSLPSDGIVLHPMIYDPNAGSTYVPYTGTVYNANLSIAGTVYGGTLDVLTGTLIVDRAYKKGGFVRGSVDSQNKLWSLGELQNCHKYDASESIADCLCNYGEITNLETARQATGVVFALFQRGLWVSGYIGNESALDEILDDIEITYQMETPAVYQIPHNVITTLLGTNNIWTDAGNINLIYTADTKMYIDNN